MYDTLIAPVLDYLTSTVVRMWDVAAGLPWWGWTAGGAAALALAFGDARRRARTTR